MKRPDFIARQSRHPSGLLGRLIARIMSVETASSNEAVVQLLNIQPADRVLEIGFGHGRTVERIAAVATEGRVAGIDHSELMVRMACRRNRCAVAEGRVELLQGDSANLPYHDCSFGKVIAVHTLYFWSDPTRHLRQIHRVLEPGGLLVLGFVSSEDKEKAPRFPDGIYRFYSCDEVRALLEEAGLGNVRIENRKSGKTELHCAVGERR